VEALEAKHDGMPVEAFDRTFDVPPAEAPPSVPIAAKVIVLPDGSSCRVDQEDHDRFAGHRWQKSTNGSGKFYVHRSETVDGKTVKHYLHREILGLKRRDGKLVDHVNGDTLDCTRENLRVTTARGNGQNRRKQRSYGTRRCSSRFKGVVRLKDSGRFVARIYADGKRLFLGRFGDERDAARAYDAAARQYYGEFALTNASVWPELLSGEAA
jgi:hypothetical protein